MHCDKCSKFCGVIVLVLGALFLLVDLGMWDFWGIKWWTVLFLLLGIGMLGKGTCEDCKTKK